MIDSKREEEIQEIIDEARVFVDAMFAEINSTVKRKYETLSVIQTVKTDFGIIVRSLFRYGSQLTDIQDDVEMLEAFDKPEKTE